MNKFWFYDNLNRINIIAKLDRFVEKSYNYKTIGSKTSNLICDEAFNKYIATPESTDKLLEDKIKYTYDDLDRVYFATKLNESLKRVISYYENGDDGKNITCNLVACDEFMVDDVPDVSYIYMYDALSRLTEVRKSNTIHKKFSYDLVVNYLRPFNILKNVGKIRIGIMPITGGFC